MTKTNNEFARIDFVFNMGCEAAGIPATGRQAGKYRRGVGAAFAARPTAADLGSMTVAALRDRLALSGLEAPTKARKADIIAILRGE